VNVDSTEVLLTDLLKFHQYVVRVVAYNVNGPGPATEELTCRTFSDGNSYLTLPYLTLPYLRGGCTRHTSTEASIIIIIIIIISIPLQWRQLVHGMRWPLSLHKKLADASPQSQKTREKQHSYSSVFP